MSPAEPRTCKEVGALLVFYTCAETSAQENARIEQHLAECAVCAAQLAEERSLHESLMQALQASEQFDTGGILLSQCRSELAEALDDLSAPPLKQSWRPFGWLRRTMVLRPIFSGALLVLAGVAVEQDVEQGGEGHEQGDVVGSAQRSDAGGQGSRQLQWMLGAATGPHFRPGPVRSQWKLSHPFELRTPVAQLLLCGRRLQPCSLPLNEIPVLDLKFRQLGRYPL